MCLFVLVYTLLHVVKCTEHTRVLISSSAVGLHALYVVIIIVEAQPVMITTCHGRECLDVVYHNWVNSAEPNCRTNLHKPPQSICE